MAPGYTWSVQASCRISPKSLKRRLFNDFALPIVERDEPVDGAPNFEIFMRVHESEPQHTKSIRRTQGEYSFDPVRRRRVPAKHFAKVLFFKYIGKTKASADFLEVLVLT